MRHQQLFCTPTSSGKQKHVENPGKRWVIISTSRKAWRSSPVTLDVGIVNSKWAGVEPWARTWHKHSLISSPWVYEVLFTKVSQPPDYICTFFGLWCFFCKTAQQIHCPRKVVLPAVAILYVWVTKRSLYTRWDEWFIMKSWACSKETGQCVPTGAQFSKWSAD